MGHAATLRCDLQNEIGTHHHDSDRTTADRNRRWTQDRMTRNTQKENRDVADISCAVSKVFFLTYYDEDRVQRLHGPKRRILRLVCF